MTVYLWQVCTYWYATYLKECIVDNQLDKK